MSDIRGFEPTEKGGRQMAAQKKRRVTRSRADLSARSPFVARRRRPLIRIVSRRRNRIYDAIPLLKFKLEPAVPATRAQYLSDFGTFKTKKSRKLKRRPKYTPAQQHTLWNEAAHEGKLELNKNFRDTGYMPKSLN